MIEHPVLAIDHGETRIGLAITDPVGIMAHPLETVDNTDNDRAISRIVELVSSRQVRRIVVGLPYLMDGSEGKAALKVRHFTNRLKENLTYEVPIDYVDERLSTVAASEKLQQAGRRSKKQKSIIDQAAAVEILNSWLQLNGDGYGY